MKKKILSLMLAMVMMLSLSVTALADNTVNPNKNGTYTEGSTSYYDATSVSFNKSFLLVGDGTSPEITFSFNIEYVDRSTEGSQYKSTGPSLTVDNLKFEEGAATKDGSGTGTQTVTITLPEVSSFSGVGVYTYKITENVPTTSKVAGVTYDSDDVYYLVISIVNGQVYNTEKAEWEDGLVRIVAVHKGSVSGEKVDGSDTDKTTGADFTNKYTANSLTVTKNVTGNLGDKTKEFSFTVAFENEDEAVAWTNAVTVNSGNGATSLTNVEGLKLTNTTVTFTLSDADSITFENIPSGIKYTVTEDNYSNLGYTTKINGTEELTTSADMTSEAAQVVVENNNEDTVDTGISLDSLPYILMLIVVAAGVVVMISRRRLDNRF